MRPVSGWARSPCSQKLNLWTGHEGLDARPDRAAAQFPLASWAAENPPGRVVADSRRMTALRVGAVDQGAHASPPRWPDGSLSGALRSHSERALQARTLRR